jgi:hypothetical protein
MLPNSNRFWQLIYPDKLMILKIVDSNHDVVGTGMVKIAKKVLNCGRNTEFLSH